MVIDLGRSEGSLIQVTSKVTEQIVEREAGDGAHAEKGGISFLQCSFNFSDYRDNINRLLKLPSGVEM